MKQRTTGGDLAYRKLYHTLAPVVFGIISRIYEGEAYNDAVLRDVMLCMNSKGMHAHSSDIRAVFTTTFQCIAQSLAGRLPAAEIERRINAERQRLLARYLQQRHAPPSKNGHNKLQPQRQFVTAMQ